MKKLIIGALVGGLILFIWQFLSWGLLNMHGKNMQYTPNQDAILQSLTSNGLEKGTYFLPSVPADTPMDQRDKLMEGRLGQPWALVSYRPALKMSMTSNMIRGFVIDLLAIGILAWLLLQFRELTMSKAILASVGVGIIGYLSISYLNSVWFENYSIPDLIDSVVPMAIIGAWLGFWLNR